MSADDSDEVGASAGVSPAGAAGAGRGFDPTISEAAEDVAWVTKASRSGSRRVYHTDRDCPYVSDAHRAWDREEAAEWFDICTECTGRRQFECDHSIYQTTTFAGKHDISIAEAEAAIDAADGDLEAASQAVSETDADGGGDEADAAAGGGEP